MLEKLTLPRVTVVVLFALIFAMAVRIPVDTDTWWHIRSGEHILEQRAVYTVDPFSHTMPGKPWNYVGWLAQVVIYLFYKVGGSAGLAIYTALLATAGMGFVYLCCAGNVYLRGFALILGAATAAVFWSARPHMMSFLLGAALLYLLHRFKRGGEPRALWFVPAVMALWANLHGGFAVGFLLMLGVLAGEIAGNLLNGAVGEPAPPHPLAPSPTLGRGGNRALRRDSGSLSPLVGERVGDRGKSADGAFNRGAPEVVGWAGVRRLAVVFVVSAGAVCINPYGAAVLGYPFQTVNIGALQSFVQEWASPNFHGHETWPFAVLLFGALAAAGRSARRLDWSDLALVAGTGFMGLTAGRNIAIFALAATPVLTRHVDDWLAARGWVIESPPEVSGVRRYVHLMLVLLVVIGAGAKAVAVLDPARVAEAQAEYLPVRVARWLNEARPAGRMFNSYNWGGYLLFAAPEYPVFIDGRTDLYAYSDDGSDGAFIDEFMRAWRGLPGWEATLDEYDIGFVVIEADGPMANRMRQAAGWSVRYEDGQAVVFERASIDE